MNQKTTKAFIDFLKSLDGYLIPSDHLNDAITKLLDALQREYIVHAQKK